MDFTWDAEHNGNVDQFQTAVENGGLNEYIHSIIAEQTDAGIHVGVITTKEMIIQEEINNYIEHISEKLKSSHVEKTTSGFKPNETTISAVTVPTSNPGGLEDLNLEEQNQIVPESPVVQFIYETGEHNMKQSAVHIEETAESDLDRQMDVITKSEEVNIILREQTITETEVQTLKSLLTEPSNTHKIRTLYLTKQSDRYPDPTTNLA